MSAGQSVSSVDTCADRVQTCVDCLIPTVNLIDIVNRRYTFGAHRCEKHCDAGTDVGRVHLVCAKRNFIGPDQ